MASAEYGGLGLRGRDAMRGQEQDVLMPKAIGSPLHLCSRHVNAL